MRTFKSPSGRLWTVELFELPKGTAVIRARDAIHAPAILRFTSDDLTLDLIDFPPDWAGLGDDDLIRLLRRATTPAFAPLVFPMTRPAGPIDEHPIKC